MSRRRMATCLMIVAALAGCELNSQPEGGHTPTVAALVSPTATPPEVVVQPSPTPSETPPAQVASPTPTYTPAPPTETPTLTETPGPYIHIIKQNETLGYIIQLYGYRDFSIIPEIVSLNNLPNADTLPGEGSQLLIPRQTPTPLPIGMELTVAADATRGTTTQGGVVLQGNPEISCFTVEEGDTIVGIAEEYSTTIEVLSQLNRDLNWFGCDFSNYSGGPDCNPNIQVGQCINVPAPTPTPTLSPTPSGSETPTPTPTFAPPMPIYPPEGGIAPAIVVRLHWVGVGVLAADEYYLVQATDLTSSQVFAQVTKETALELPVSMIPGDGQTHTINWRVAVATPNEQGVFSIIGGASPARSFQWQSR